MSTLNFSTLTSLSQMPAVKQDDKGKDTGFSLWGDDGFGFDDVIDLVNPLQHIPGVNHIYRGVTGDDVAPITKLIGGALSGGPVGLGAAAVDVGMEAISGHGLVDTAMGLLGLQEEADVTFSSQQLPDAMMAQLNNQSVATSETATTIADNATESAYIQAKIAEALKAYEHQLNQYRS